ncbi:MAG: hypothetical protein ACM3UZ_11635 [Acidobacteriota bacterium]
MEDLTTKIREKWAQLNQREKFLMVTFAAMLISYLVYTQYIEVHYNSVLARQSELARIQDYLNKIKVYGSLSEINLKTQKVRDEINNYQKFAPHMKDTPALLVTLHDLRAKYQLLPPQDAAVEKKQIAFSNLVQFKKYSTFDITFALSGTRKNLFDFISEIENMKRPVVIQHLSIKTPGIDRVEGEMTIRVFVMDILQSDPKAYPFMEDFVPGGVMPYDIFGPSSASTANSGNGGNMPTNNGYNPSYPGYTAPLPIPPSTSSKETMPDLAPPSGDATINPAPTTDMTDSTTTPTPAPDSSTNSGTQIGPNTSVPPEWWNDDYPGPPPE